MTLDVKNRQLEIQKAYFWVASALFTVFGAAFHGMFTGKDFIHLGLCSGFFDASLLAQIHKAVAFVAFAGCAFVVFTGIENLRGKGNGTKAPFIKSLHHGLLDTVCKTGPDYKQVNAFLYIMKMLQESTIANEDCLGPMGIHLRRTSNILRISFIHGLVAFLM